MFENLIKKSSPKSIKSHPEFDPKWRKSEPGGTPKRRQEAKMIKKRGGA